MVDQHCIAATLATAAAVAILQLLLAEAGGASRTEIARRVCREFGFLDSRGALQLASCLKALRSLHAAGRIRLPAPRHGGRRRCQPRRLGQAVPQPSAVPASAGAVQAGEFQSQSRS